MTAQLKLGDDANLFDLFLARVQATPEGLAYRQFDGTRWTDYRWREVAVQVARWRAAMVASGLRAGDRAALCLRNRLEWALFDLAALSLRVVTVPLYFGDRPESMAYCINDCGARLLLIEDGTPWAALREQVPALERVVYLDGSAAPDARAVKLADWLPAQGEALAPSGAPAGEMATLVYTSGTTGRPKGVMLSHRNIVSNTVASASCARVEASDRFLSFLPLSHMLERTGGYYLPMLVGAQTVYARSITQLADDMREQQPTILICVPRIFERIWSRMQENLPAGSPKRRLFDAAVAVGWRRFRGEASALDHLFWPILRLLVARKLYARLGGRVRLIVSGGAPLAPNLARIFMGLGLPILQGYGLTETSPVIAVNRESENDPFSVGRALPGVEIRCADNGELLTRGPHVMLGYWNNPAATAATIDADGWLHTGDVVQLRDGRVYITGRVKDILVLSNGEKVPPADVEQAILQDPVFEQVMLTGEGRPKLGLLCVSAHENLAELCERANQQLRDFPGYARICHIARVAEPWTIENGLLTPTMKIKRAEIARRCGAQIEAMYADPTPCERRREPGMP